VSAPVDAGHGSTLNQIAHRLGCHNATIVAASTAPPGWRWSSYRASAGTEPPPAFLSADEMLASFAPTKNAAQAIYRSFIADAIGKELPSPVA
jgi:hypothetical protein